MKKIIFSLFVVLTLLMGVNSEIYSQCILPAGVSSTPPWTQGIRVKVFLNAAKTCWVEYDYCF